VRNWHNSTIQGGNYGIKESGGGTSNSKKAKEIIRSEIRGYFKPHEYGVRSTVDAMKQDADAYNNGRRGWQSNYSKGAGLVDAGSLACYYNDQRKMLGKIYGAEKVKDWSGDKVHNTYRHLIGREYDAMLQEQNKKRAERKAQKAKKLAKKKK